MNELEYEEALNEELEKHSDSALTSINIVIDAIPEKAKTFYLEVFPSQDGDGFFGVRANFDGPDLYVLNKPFEEIGEIFNPRYTENGVEPFIPLVDPFDIDYEANNIAVDCAATWLEKVWENSHYNKVTIPVYIVGHDEYGTVTPLKLKNG